MQKHYKQFPNNALQNLLMPSINHGDIGVRLQFEAVLFDLFDTLVLVEDEKAFYTPSLTNLHNFLVKKGINTPFSDFNRAYFEVRDKFYTESRKTLEEPHFNVRVAQTLGRLGYNMDASDEIVSGATLAFADEFMRYVRLDEDAPPVLQKLKEKYKLGVVSNFAIPECCWKLLEKFGLKDFLDIVVISGEVNRRKPSPEIFEKALKALNVEASRVVFVGDMPSLDIEGPKNVGMKAILIQRKTAKETINVKPDCTIKNLKELLAALETCRFLNNDAY
jgi:putative hydrolase of the HAD superfamily